MLSYALLGVLYIACCILSYGLNFAYWQRHYPSLAVDMYKDDVQDSIMQSLAGPISLAVALLLHGTKHGLKWR